MPRGPNIKNELQGRRKTECLNHDPSDEKFVELAIELAATHIISSDHDLLSLPNNRGESGKRFRQRLPNVMVVDAGAFLQKHGEELGIE